MGFYSKKIIIIILGIIFATILTFTVSLYLQKSHVVVTEHVYAPIRLESFKKDMNLCIKDATSQALVYVGLDNKNETEDDIDTKLDSIKQRLNERIEQELPKCERLKKYKRAIYSKGNVTAKTNFEDNKVEFIIEYPISLLFAGGEFKFDKPYIISYNLDLKKILVAENMILQKNDQDDINLNILEMTGFNMTRLIKNNTIFFTIIDPEHFISGQEYKFIFSKK